MEGYTTLESMNLLNVTKTGLYFMIDKYNIKTWRGEKWNRLYLDKAAVDALVDRPRRRRRDGSKRETTRVTQWGYVERFYPSHPHANSSGYVPEHKLVAEASLGRPLAPGEVVHHMDGDRKNNSPDNLKVFSNQGEHLQVGHWLNAVWRRWSYRLEHSKSLDKDIRAFASDLRKAIKEKNEDRG